MIWYDMIWYEIMWCAGMWCDEVSLLSKIVFLLSNCSWRWIPIAFTNSLFVHMNDISCTFPNGHRQTKGPVKFPTSSFSYLAIVIRSWYFYIFYMNYYCIAFVISNISLSQDLPVLVMVDPKTTARLHPKDRRDRRL